MEWKYKIATQYEWTHTSNMGHYHMASCLHELLKQSNLKWSFRHVKGHQDESTNIADVDIFPKIDPAYTLP